MEKNIGAAPNMALVEKAVRELAASIERRREGERNAA